MSILRHGYFLKRLACNRKHSWLFVEDSDWAWHGTNYYKWCTSCDRMENIGFIYRDTDKPERDELLDKFGLTGKELIPLVSHNNDYIAMRKQKFPYDGDNTWTLVWMVAVLIGIVVILL